MIAKSMDDQELYRCLQQRLNMLVSMDLAEDLGAITPQVRPFMMKTDATQVQPYPPSGERSAATFILLNNDGRAYMLSDLNAVGLLTGSALQDMDVTGWTVTCSENVV